MLKFFGFIFLLLLIAIPVGTYYYRVPLLEKALTSSLDTPVKLQDVTLGWNTITVKGFQIPEARLYVKRITLEMPLTAIWQDEVIISSATIEEPHLIPFIPKSIKSAQGKVYTIDNLTILNLHLPFNQKVPYIEWHAIGKRTPFTLDGMLSEIISRVIALDKVPHNKKVVLRHPGSDFGYPKIGQVA